MKRKPEVPDVQAAGVPQPDEKSTRSSAAEAEEDSFLKSIALRQDFAETAGVEKVLLVVPFRKPNKDEFFRCHPSPDHRHDTMLVEFKTEREVFVTTAAMEAAVIELATPARLVQCISRQGTTFVWPVKLPGVDRRSDAWRTSAIEICELAVDKWVRMHADMHLNAYQAYTAQGVLEEPTWPALTFEAILKLALKDRVIDNVDHPAVRAHRGLR